MLQTLKDAFIVKKIRNKLLFTILLLIIYRIGAYITVPGINVRAMQSVSHSGLVSMLNIFSGGGLTNYSLFAMGVSPFITAQIVIQLLQMKIVPRFYEWSKEGQVGRQHLNKATLYLTIILAFFQSVGITAGFNSLSQLHLVEHPSIFTFINVGIVLTGGSMLTTFMGNMITDKGIGQGVSMIIFAGIIAQTPTGVQQLWREYVEGETGLDLIKAFLFIIALVLIVLVIVTFTTWFQQAERRVPIQYTKRATISTKDSYLPLKVNVSGVIPVIFASSFMSTPQTFMMFFQKYSGSPVFRFIKNVFNLQTLDGAILYTLLIIAFSFFYASVQVNPEKLSKNLVKQGSYIPGVWPGKTTQKYIVNILIRLSAVGSIFLGVVALIPLFAQDTWNLNESIGLAGTSELIIIGVAIDTIKQIRGLTMKREYIGFIRIPRPDGI